MASIKVKFRASSVKDRGGAICYQIIHERKVRIFRTNFIIFPNEWDAHRSAVTAQHAGERKPIVLSIRDNIRRDVERLSKIARKLDDQGLDYTADDVFDAFKQYLSQYSLFNYMESLIAKLRSNGKIRTSETYTAALNSFKEFNKNTDLMLDCLTSSIMVDYEAWHKSKGNSPNTISFYTRILRAAYNRAVEEEAFENCYPFRHVYTGIEKTTKRALALPMIKKIKALDLALTPSIDFARDMFMLSFYLRGMSFVDMAFLKKSDLKNGAVTYRRRKTGQRLSIAWTQEMQAILSKYPENPTQYLLPIIKTVGCNERSAYRNVGSKINHNLKSVAELAEIKTTLTMYVARHSWASAARAKGISLSIISEGMGHDSETTTQIYLACLATSVVDEANSLIIGSL